MPTVVAAPENSTVAGDLEAVIRFALSQVGKPYVFGTKGPNTYDCSGFVLASYAQTGIGLPHWTGLQIRKGVPVSRTELRRGDLVFPDPGHVQIFLGNNQVVEARGRAWGVTQGPMRGFWAARRVIGSNVGSIPKGGIPELIPNPFETGDAIADFLRKVSDPHLWERVSYVLIGIILLILAGAIMLTGSLSGPVNAVRKVI